MREALKKLIILPVAAGLLYFILSPAATFSAAVKVRHILSVYNDNAGDNPVKLIQPEGVGCGEDSFIVADSGNGRLIRFSLGDGKLTAAAEIRTRQLVSPSKVQINSKGDIYTLDSGQRRIVHLGPDGKFMAYIDPQGSPSPEESAVRNFAIDKDDNIHILDVYSARVLVLTSEGKFLRALEIPRDGGFFSDITVNYKGDILLLDSTKARVVSAKKDTAVFSPLTGSLREYARFPSSFVTDTRGRIYIVDRNGSRMLVLGQDGSYLGQVSQLGWKEGLLNHPSHACLNTRGELFIADTGNNRVQIFELLR